MEANSIMHRKVSGLHHLFHSIPKRNSFDKIEASKWFNDVDADRWKTDWKDHDDMIEMLNPRNTYRGALFNDGKIIKIQSLCYGFKCITRLIVAFGNRLISSCLSLLNPIKQWSWIWFKLWKSHSFFGLSNQNKNYFWLG